MARGYKSYHLVCDRSCSTGDWKPSKIAPRDQLLPLPGMILFGSLSTIRKGSLIFQSGQLTTGNPVVSQLLLCGRTVSEVNWEAEISRTWTSLGGDGYAPCREMAVDKRTLRDVHDNGNATVKCVR